MNLFVWSFSKCNWKFNNNKKTIEVLQSLAALDSDWMYKSMEALMKTETWIAFDCRKTARHQWLQNTWNKNACGEVARTNFFTIAASHFNRKQIKEHKVFSFFFFWFVIHSIFFQLLTCSFVAFASRSTNGYLKLSSCHFQHSTTYKLRNGNDDSSNLLRFFYTLPSSSSSCSLSSSQNVEHCSQFIC